MSRALGLHVLLNYQIGRDEEARRYHRRYREVVGPRLHSKTAANYAILQRALEARGISLVAVEYPGRNVEPLRRQVEGARGVVVVDNEEPFLRAARERPLNETYRDLFAGIFGHLTAAGNELLAKNVAAGIRDAVESGGPAPTPDRLP